MDNSLVWMLIFAGAVIGLLAVFLIASEKELKKKRAEIESLNAQADKAAGTSGATGLVSPTPNEGAEVMGLRAKTQELQKRVAALEDDLAESHKVIDEMRAGQRRDAGAETELLHLRSANEQLKADLARLSAQAQASEPAAQDAAHAEQIAKLTEQLTAAHDQLQASQAKLQALESHSPAPADTSAMEAMHRQATQKLEGQISDLQKELTASAERLRELDSLRQKLSEAERTHEEQHAALARQENDQAQLRARAAEAEEHRKRLLSLQPAYNQLMTKQAALANIHRDFSEELHSFAKMMSAAADVANGQTTSLPAVIAVAPMAMTETHTIAADSELPMVAAIASEEKKAKRKFNIFHGLALVIGAGIVGALLLSSGSEPTPVAVAKPNPAPAAKAPAPASTQVANVDKPAPGALPELDKKVEAKAKPNPAANDQAKLPVQPKAEAAVTYQITQATKVFAAPSDQAQQVGEIDAGFNVNVVNSRDGWLEIRSKHGRPPGFIRREAAARLGN